MEGRTFIFAPLRIEKDKTGVLLIPFYCPVYVLALLFQVIFSIVSSFVHAFSAARESAQA
jgi:hypothetical protein